MIDILLKAKHWQLFVIVIGIPIIGQIVLTVAIFSTITLGETDPVAIMEIFNSYGYVFPLITTVPYLLLFVWYYAVVVRLKDKLTADVTIPFKTLKAFIIYCAIYLPLIGFLMGMLFTNLDGGGMMPMPSPWILLIVPFHLFMAFAIIYIFVYVGKIIKSAEAAKNLKFGEYAGDFALCWFWFIGVWILQPRIQKMLGMPDEAKEKTEEDVL